jgi:hypothetical protein
VHTCLYQSVMTRSPPAAAAAGVGGPRLPPRQGAPVVLSESLYRPSYSIIRVIVRVSPPVEETIRRHCSKGHVGPARRTVTRTRQETSIIDQLRQEASSFDQFLVHAPLILCSLAHPLATRGRFDSPPRGYIQGCIVEIRTRTHGGRRRRGTRTWRPARAPARSSTRSPDPPRLPRRRPAPARQSCSFLSRRARGPTRSSPRQAPGRARSQMKPENPG